MNPLVGALLALAASALCAPHAHASEARQLLLEQQQDALDLALRHHGSSAGRADLAPADRLAIDRLRIEQRLEQQRLEIDQWQRQRALERKGAVLGDDDVRRRLDVQRDAFRTERQVQSLRFQADEQRLVQSMPRQPLQPPPTPGALRLP